MSGCYRVVQKPTRDRLLQRLLEAHNPSLLCKTGSVVTQLWHDGCLTQQMSGSALWLRTLFTVIESYAHRDMIEFLKERLPERYGERSFVVVPSQFSASLARAVNAWRPEDG